MNDAPISFDPTSPTVPSTARSAGRPPRIALVGDRTSAVRAHDKISMVLGRLDASGDGAVDPYWIHSSAVDRDEIAGFDGVWAVPGSPYASAEGVLAAIEVARTAGIPTLGTCGGFQHLLLEFARNACQVRGAANAETDPDSPDLLIVPLDCSLVGQEAAVTVAPGTLAASVMGAGTTTERYFCNFGLAERFLPTLEAAGLVVSGRDAEGGVRVVELTGHPFLLGTLFQPELSCDESWTHPVIRGFLDAARHHVGAGAAQAPV